MYSLGNNTLTSISYRGWNCQTLCWRSGSWVPLSAQQNPSLTCWVSGHLLEDKGPRPHLTNSVEHLWDMFRSINAINWQLRVSRGSGPDVGDQDTECAFKHVGILQMTLPICNSAIVISAKWTGFIFFHFDFWGVFEFSHLQVGNFNFHQMMICFQSVYLIVLSSAHYFSRQWYKDKLQNNRLDSL